MNDIATQRQDIFISFFIFHFPHGAYHADAGMVIVLDYYDRETIVNDQLFFLSFYSFSFFLILFFSHYLVGREDTMIATQQSIMYNLFFFK